MDGMQGCVQKLQKRKSDNVVFRRLSLGSLFCRPAIWKYSQNAGKVIHNEVNNFQVHRMCPFGKCHVLTYQHIAHEKVFFSVHIDIINRISYTPIKYCSSQKHLPFWINFKAYLLQRYVDKITGSLQRYSKLVTVRAYI
jgi:hypothetical protein